MKNKTPLIPQVFVDTGWIEPTPAILRGRADYITRTRRHLTFQPPPKTTSVHILRIVESSELPISGLPPLAVIVFSGLPEHPALKKGAIPTPS